MKIGNYEVGKEIVQNYINHFGEDKSNIQYWENKRSELHNYIFESLKLDRFSEEGREFSIELDIWAEPQILRFDPIVARAKSLSNAKTDSEIKFAQLQLKMEMTKKEFMIKSGGRAFNINDKNICRICKKETVDGVPRVNDHLQAPTGFDNINSPICMDCANNNPDEYHTAFRKQFWSRK